MITGLSLDATVDFVSEFDPANKNSKSYKEDPEAPDAKPTVFTLLTLDSRVMGHLRDMATRLSVNPNAKPDENVDTEVAMNEVAFQICQFGLGGAEPFEDQNGGVIEWKTQNRRLRGNSYKIAHEEIIARLPLRVISEVATELRKLNNLGEDEGNE